MRYSYKTRGVCAREIDFNLDGDVVSDISFLGGCNGNLKAISKLCDGMTVEQIAYQLHFATSASLDKFYKRMRGITPLAVRKN